MNVCTVYPFCLKFGRLLLLRIKQNAFIIKIFLRTLPEIEANLDN